MQGMRFPSLGREDHLEKGIVTLFCILAWKNPMDRGAGCTMQSMGREESDMMKRLSMHACTVRSQISTETKSW